MKLQHDFGPDEILPRRWKTERFAYLQPLEVLADESVSEDIEENRNLCAICMNHLSVQHVNDPEAIQLQSEASTVQVFRQLNRFTSTHYMKTPCNHDFHIGCLLSWAKLKMDCPTCRQPLPPVA